MWISGTIDGVLFEIKVFDTGSQFGINGGRISKLFLKSDGKILANYDRGWDIEPKIRAAKKVLKTLIEKYN